jgi:hypothetical protein
MERYTEALPLDIFFQKGTEVPCHKWDVVGGENNDNSCRFA